VVSARDRRLEFALIRALGLTMRQFRLWMLVEQVTIVVAGVIVGTGIGVGLGALVLPLVSLTQQGGEVVPGVIVTFPWTTIGFLLMSLVAGLVVGLTIVNLMTRRMVVGTTLRAGSEL
jgi:ABC-type antimicrobial peptide transport system permease subunit